MIMRARALALPTADGASGRVGRASEPSMIGSIATVSKFSSGRPAAAPQAPASSMCTCSVCREGRRMAYDVLGAERAGGDRHRQRRVDAAGEAEHGLAPSGRVHHLAQPLRLALEDRRQGGSSRSSVTRSSYPPAAADLGERLLAVAGVHVDRGDRVAEDGGRSPRDASSAVARTQ